MRLLTLTIFLGVSVAACGGHASSPASPSSTPTLSLNAVTGTWSGTSSDSVGQNALTWRATQNGNVVTATANLTDTGRGMTGDGTMQGTMSGRMMTFHMVVPNGGFGGMMASCWMSVDGRAEISPDGHTMTGTYAGNMAGMMSQWMGTMWQERPCGGPMNDGRFTLTR